MNFKEKLVHTFNPGFYLPGGWLSYICSVKSMKFNFDFTVRFSYDLTNAKASAVILEEFNRKLTSRMSKNWVTLLGNMDDCDMKIKTSDGLEIMAHKLVVKGKKT